MSGAGTGTGAADRRARGKPRRAAGELESSVLGVLWSAPGPLTVAQVNDRLPGDLAHTTVLTILTRLYEKGLLTRGRAGRGFAYRPVGDEATHTAEQMRSLLDGGTDREAVLARFVSELPPRDEELLLKLLAGAERP
ncbi:BlaI/MecI/CopY family transcriptional regulator [Streptomyces sp. NPDC059443]|uniref:BlaI/MecI/CopY family transcriptional regulator n=1 Tax=unclassified Streptomyces TaxID=2593676 RepID=UPI0036A14E0A